MLFDFDNQKWEELVRSNVGFVEWSRSGRFVYFKRIGNEAAFLRVSIENRKVEEVVTLKNIRNAGWAGGCGSASHQRTLHCCCGIPALRRSMHPIGMHPSRLF